MGEEVVKGIIWRRIEEFIDFFVIFLVNIYISWGIIVFMVKKDMFNICIVVVFGNWLVSFMGINFDDYRCVVEGRGVFIVIIGKSLVVLFD